MTGATLAIAEVKTRSAAGFNARILLLRSVHPKERLNKRMEAWIWAWRFGHWQQNGLLGPC